MSFSASFAKELLMSKISIARKPYIIGVMGSHRAASPAVMEDARRLGEALARRGYVLLTGGGPGVMRAACEGAHKAGGLVIGVLPNDKQRPLEKYPNEFVDIPIFTGMYDARNVIPHWQAYERGTETCDGLRFRPACERLLPCIRAPELK